MMELQRRRGRPSRAGVRSTARIDFRTTPEERIELLRVAAENRMPVATVIREAVNTFVQDYREGIVFIGRRR